MNAIIGNVILCAHDSQARGDGLVHRQRPLARRDGDRPQANLKRAPTANFVVKYKSASTDKKLNGCVSTELSRVKHGRAEWWVLLERESSA